MKNRKKGNKNQPQTLFDLEHIRLRNGRFATGSESAVDLWKTRALLAEQRNQSYSELLIRFNDYFTKCATLTTENRQLKDKIQKMKNCLIYENLI
ncbi:MAG: hypothetical protein LBN95_03855 [Prevotellaceae bacterium]|jgi:predicted  nucleic acid-binding Zn-ribbon protein|nr:hypothetical protein [Prevotellaceae bacterium]